MSRSHLPTAVAAVRTVPALLVVTVAAAAGLLTACSGDAAEPVATVAVSSTDDECVLDLTEAPAGTVLFTVTNNGSAETEFYLFAGNGTDVVAEVEHIGPGLSRDLRATLDAGTYVTACKPGMTGDGIRGEFTVG